MNLLPFPNSKISATDIDIVAYSTDASFYKIQPEFIVHPVNDIEIAALMSLASTSGKSLTFRAAGTSLSGQALSESIVVDISRGWKKFSYNPDDEIISAETGVIGGTLNKFLTKYNRIIGPDPASINSCMVGGIAANNSSGMRSGINQNAYNSVASMRMILSNGLILDTSVKDSSSILLRHAPGIYHGLIRLRDEVRSDKNLSDLIRRNYRIKNTVGYSLNSFLDFDSPSDILLHLMIGSEGTLGFISSVSLRTFEDKPMKLTGLAFFEYVKEAAKAILPIRKLGVTAVEIIDNNSLKSIESKLSELNLNLNLNSGVSALLWEFSEANERDIVRKRKECELILKDIIPIKYIITADRLQQLKLWSIRKGLLPALGAGRPKNTTLILEDICVDAERFHEFIPELQNLFIKWNFDNTGIYGHGMDGNLHFMLTQDFNQSTEITRYSSFMDELADLVVDKFDGSLKAEHGTGRNMVPFVRKEWGDKAYQIMLQIKSLLDPMNILNPGVIINPDSNVHLKNIKLIPSIDDEIDKCIDCGFCESSCPSRDITLSPRKRIAALRHFQFSEIINEKSLQSKFNYFVNDTCAVDSLCSTACPVGIDTGKIIKSIRAGNANIFSKQVGKLVANNFGLFVVSVNASLKVFNVIRNFIPVSRLNNMINLLGKVVGINNFYMMNKWIGSPVKLRDSDNYASDFIYFPACVSRMLGTPHNSGNKSLIEVMIQISETAGIKLKIPSKVNNECCGTIFSSKGLDEAAEISANRIIDFLWNKSSEGRMKIVIDSTSCYNTIKTFVHKLTPTNRQRYGQLNILDSVEYIKKFIIPNLKIINKLNRVVIHQTCSSKKMNIQDLMIDVASYCAEDVIVPLYSGCCGMAGDRGLMFPELTDSATKPEAEELENIESDGCYSSNIPCEIGMSNATDKQYLHIAYLVHDLIKIN